MKMRAWLLAVAGILGLALYASPQNPQGTVITLTFPGATASGADLSLKGARRETAGEQITLSGGVEAVIDGVRISAERAVYQRDEGTIVLDGTVRLALPKASTGVRPTDDLRRLLKPVP